MSQIVVVKGGSSRLVPEEEVAARVEHGWKPAADLPALDQELLRKRFKGEKGWTKPLAAPPSADRVADLRSSSKGKVKK